MQPTVNRNLCWFFVVVVLYSLIQEYANLVFHAYHIIFVHMNRIEFCVALDDTDSKWFLNNCEEKRLTTIRAIEAMMIFVCECGKYLRWVNLFARFENDSDPDATHIREYSTIKINWPRCMCNVYCCTRHTHLHHQSPASTCHRLSSNFRALIKFRWLNRMSPLFHMFRTYKMRAHIRVFQSPIQDLFTN